MTSANPLLADSLFFRDAAMIIPDSSENRGTLNNEAISSAVSMFPSNDFVMMSLINLNYLLEIISSFLAEMTTKIHFHILLLSAPKRLFPLVYESH